MKEAFDIKNKIQSGQKLRISTFKKDVRVTQPHRHKGYLELIYLTQGTGFHYIDSKAYVVEPGIVFIVRKEQMHNWELSSEPDGFVMIVTKEFVDQLIDKEIDSLLYQISQSGSYQIDTDMNLAQLFSVLCLEQETDQYLSSVAREGLLKAVLAKILSVKPSSRVLPRSVDQGLYVRFTDMLAHETQPKNSVAHYAKLLNTSPQNLNQACQKHGNHSASNFIADLIIKEAKRHLLYTDRTVAQIALALDFNDASHFIKFFRRFTGTTPKSFRQSV